MSAGENSVGSSEDRVALHYATENLEERILRAFEAAGKARASVTADDLMAVDEFHIGGREATEEIAARMQLRRGIGLLDVGSGIGGPARYFASVHGCAVTGIDLTPEYVGTARALTALVGMSPAVKFEQGNAMHLPFADETFEGAYIFHVGMNAEDKSKLFRELKRVLRPGSVLAIYDVMRIGPGDLQFPVPWASAVQESFVASVEDYRNALAYEGFSILAERERKEFAIDFFERMRQRTAQEGPQPFGIHLIMGETGVAKTSNVLDALRRGVIAPVQMFART